MKRRRRNRPWFEKHPVKSLAVMFSALTVAGVSHLLTNWQPPVQANDAGYVSDATNLFISQIAESARQLGQEHDIYASVMIAQAIHESDSGRSGLGAPPYYNLFGIKGTYLGSGVTLQTWEDDGSGNAYTINDTFRVYPSWYESLLDYVSLVKSPYYSGAWKSNTSSYQDATLYLTGRYATDTNYANKLNRIIETYGLTKYDSSNVVHSSGLEWNPYRGTYTSSEVLSVDRSYASKEGIAERYPEPFSSQRVDEVNFESSVSSTTDSDTGLVFNRFRGQMTSKETLLLDENWSKISQ